MDIAQNQKWHLFFEKGVFDMSEKVGFTNCVFEKLCFLKALFFTVCKQKTETWWKIVGCFWTWQKGVFCLFLFSGFSVIVFIFAW